MGLLVRLQKLLKVLKKFNEQNKNTEHGQQTLPRLEISRERKKSILFCQIKVLN